jgi:CrcB protein
VAFALAAGIGAPLRHVVGGAVQERHGAAGAFPWGTFVVNVTGSLLLGIVAGLGLYHAFPAAPRLVLGTGFCGAYTTFSTFSVETVRLLEDGAVRPAVWSTVATLGAGAAAAGAGLAVASL